MGISKLRPHTSNSFNDAHHVVLDTRLFPVRRACSLRRDETHNSSSPAHNSALYFLRPSCPATLQEDKNQEKPVTKMACLQTVEIGSTVNGSILPHHSAWLLHVQAPRLFRERENPCPFKVTCSRSADPRY